MRKVSELLKLALPIYASKPRLFMCHVVNDVYEYRGDVSLLGFTVDERLACLFKIQKEIGGCVTLNEWMLVNTPGYREATDDYGKWGHPERLSWRVKFWQDLIAKLEQVGE